MLQVCSSIAVPSSSSFLADRGGLQLLRWAYMPIDEEKARRLLKAADPAGLTWLWRAAGLLHNISATPEVKQQSIPGSLGDRRFPDVVFCKPPAGTAGAGLACSRRFEWHRADEDCLECPSDEVEQHGVCCVDPNRVPPQQSHSCTSRSREAALGFGGQNSAYLLPDPSSNRTGRVPPHAELMSLAGRPLGPIPAFSETAADRLLRIVVLVRSLARPHQTHDLTLQLANHLAAWQLHPVAF